MREIEFLRPESPVVVDAIGLLRDRGVIGEIAAKYLKDRVERRELVARSFTPYKQVLDAFTQKAKRKADDGSRHHYEYCTVSEAFSRKPVLEFLAEAPSPFMMRLRRQVLRHFGRACNRGEIPEPLTIPLEDLRRDGVSILRRPAPRRDADSDPADGATDEGTGERARPRPVASGRMPTAVEASAIEAAADDILRTVTGFRSKYMAKDVTVMRAAAVAFCRFGGAVVADLVGMKMADLLTAAPDEAAHTARHGLGVYWRARRPRRQPGVSGPDKFATVEIEYEPRALAPIAAWIAIRKRDGAAAADPVFVHPTTREPVTRQLIWRLVAGHPVTRRAGQDTSYSAQGNEAPEGCAADHRGSSVFLSPSRLRHVQGMKLVERYLGGEALTSALRRHMGVSGRGIAWIYARDKAAAEAASAGNMAADARGPTALPQ